MLNLKLWPFLNQRMIKQCIYVLSIMPNVTFLSKFVIFQMALDYLRFTIDYCSSSSFICLAACLNSPISNLHTRDVLPSQVQRPTSVAPGSLR